MPAAEPRGLRETIKAGARRLASFQAGIVLKAFYYLGLGPAALWVRFMRKDPTGWVQRESVDPAEHLRGLG